MIYLGERKTKQQLKTGILVSNFSFHFFPFSHRRVPTKKKIIKTWLTLNDWLILKIACQVAATTVTTKEHCTAELEPTTT